MKLGVNVIRPNMSPRQQMAALPALWRWPEGSTRGQPGFMAALQPTQFTQYHCHNQLPLSLAHSGVVAVGQTTVTETTSVTQWPHIMDMVCCLGWFGLMRVPL
jgi:hypothetical protein